jgi:hypothetical protein
MRAQTGRRIEPTIDNPERANAVSDEKAAQLARRLDEAADVADPGRWRAGARPKQLFDATMRSARRRRR